MNPKFITSMFLTLMLTQQILQQQLLKNKNNRILDSNRILPKENKEKMQKLPDLIPQQFKDESKIEKYLKNLKFNPYQNHNFKIKLQKYYTSNNLILEQIPSSKLAKDFLEFLEKSQMGLEVLKMKKQENYLINKFTNDIIEWFLNLISDSRSVIKDNEYVTIIAPTTGYRYQILNQKQFLERLLSYLKFYDELTDDIQEEFETREIIEKMIQKTQDFVIKDSFAYEETDDFIMAQNNLNSSMRSSYSNNHSSQKSQKNLRNSMVVKQKDKKQEKINIQKIIFENMKLLKGVENSSSAKALNFIQNKYLKKFKEKTFLKECYNLFFEFYKEGGNLYKSSQPFKFNSYDKRYIVSGYKIKESFYKKLDQQIRMLENCVLDNMDLDNIEISQFFKNLSEFDSRFHLFDKIDSHKEYVEYYFLFNEKDKDPDPIRQQQIEHQLMKEFYQKKLKKDYDQIIQQQEAKKQLQNEVFQEKIKDIIQQKEQEQFDLNKLENSQLKPLLKPILETPTKDFNPEIFEQFSQFQEHLRDFIDLSEEYINQEEDNIHVKITYNNMLWKRVKQSCLKLKEVVKKARDDNNSELIKNLAKVFYTLNNFEKKDSFVFEEYTKNMDEEMQYKNFDEINSILDKEFEETSSLYNQEELIDNIDEDIQSINLDIGNQMSLKEKIENMIFSITELTLQIPDENFTNKINNFLEEISNQIQQMNQDQLQEIDQILVNLQKILESGESSSNQWFDIYEIPTEDIEQPLKELKLEFELNELKKNYVQIINSLNNIQDQLYELIGTQRDKIYFLKNKQIEDKEVNEEQLSQFLENPIEENSPYEIERLKKSVLKLPIFKLAKIFKQPYRSIQNNLLLQDNLDLINSVNDIEQNLEIENDKIIFDEQQLERIDDQINTMIQHLENNRIQDDGSNQVREILEYIQEQISKIQENNNEENLLQQLKDIENEIIQEEDEEYNDTISNKTQEDEIIDLILIEFIECQDCLQNNYIELQN